MYKNSLPRFTAEASLHRLGQNHVDNSGHAVIMHNRVVAALQERDAPTRQDCLMDCMGDCIESEQSQGACRSQCNDKCQSHIPPYQCTEQDNSVNHNLCLGGMWAWEQACLAECQLLNGVPMAGPALSAACSAGCSWLAGKMRADCPPATICV